MAGKDDDNELGAIEQLISALEPLQADARQRVLSYVFQRLGLAAPGNSANSPLPGASTSSLGVQPSLPAPAVATDIRSFATQKAPTSQLERTAVVAFYLSDLAPQTERKAEITGADLTKYSKQAGLPAPTNTRGALFSARHAGYFDPAGHGKYKLNAVGYNLVAHNLPGGAAAPAAARGRPAKRRRTSAKASKVKRRRR